MDKSVDLYYYNKEGDLRVQAFPGHDHATTEFTATVAQAKLIEQPHLKLLVNPNAIAALEFKAGD